MESKAKKAQPRSFAVTQVVATIEEGDDNLTIAGAALATIAHEFDYNAPGRNGWEYQFPVLGPDGGPTVTVRMEVST